MPDEMKDAAAADHNAMAAEQANKAEADRKAEDARAQQSFQNAPVMRNQGWQDAEQHTDTAPPQPQERAPTPAPAPPPVPPRSPAQDSIDAMRLQHAHEQLQHLIKTTDQATDALYFRDDDIPRPLAMPEFSDEIAAAVNYMKYWVRREEILRHDHNMDHAECKRRNP